MNATIYYFKIDNKWYFMEANLEGLPESLKEHYPAKEDQDVRMAELQNLAPRWYHKGFEERDTSLIKKVDYESTYYEEKGGLTALNILPVGGTLRSICPWAIP